MWLLGVILDNICGFFKVCFSRTLSKQIYRNCAVLMTGTVVVAVLVFTAGSFTGGGKNQVYAVKASRNAEEAGEGEDVKEEELQAGLMGIVASEVRGGVCKKHRKHRLLCTAESAGKSDGWE